MTHELVVQRREDHGIYESDILYPLQVRGINGTCPEFIYPDKNPSKAKM